MARVPVTRSSPVAAQSPEEERDQKGVNRTYSAFVDAAHALADEVEKRSGAIPEGLVQALVNSRRKYLDYLTRFSRKFVGIED